MSSVSNVLDLEICSAISARLEQRGVSRDVLLRAYNAAVHHGTSFCAELVQQGEVAEPLIYAAIADFLDVEFTDDVHPSRIIISGEEAPSVFRDVGQVMGLGLDGGSCLYIAPSENRIRTICEY